jgi:hypothetical protein
LALVSVASYPFLRGWKIRDINLADDIIKMNGSETVQLRARIDFDNPQRRVKYAVRRSSKQQGGVCRPAASRKLEG